MSRNVFDRCGIMIAVVALTCVVGWPAAGVAQTPAGAARAAKTTVLGGTIVLSDTGPLIGGDDARQASQVAGVVPSVLNAESLHAVTIGWLDQAVAEASLGALGLTVGGNGISAGFVMARAAAAIGVPSAGATTIEGLSINGVPIAVTGQPNQTILIPGGRIVINEQQPILPTGVTVNALHIVIDGVADVVIASATAGI